MRKCGLAMGAFIFTLLFLVPDSAHARKVEDVFRKSIIITTKRAPTRFASQGAFVRFLRANRKLHIWPLKTNKKEWRFEFMAFFAKPLNDLEVTVKFYDITEGKKFVAGDTFYIPQKGQRIFASNMVLNQPRFAVDRKYQMIILTARQVLLAQTNFWLRGEKERYSGKVTFTDDDTKVKD